MDHIIPSYGPYDIVYYMDLNHIHLCKSLNENPAGVKNEAMFNFANRTSTTNQSYVSNKPNRSNRSKLTRSNGTSEYDNEKNRNKDRKRDSEEYKAWFSRLRAESYINLVTWQVSLYLL